MKRKSFLRHSLLLGGLTFVKTGRLSAFYTKVERLFLNKVKFIWAGAITTNAVKVHAKLTNPTSSARLVVSTHPSLTSPVYGTFSSADLSNNYVARLSVDGLQPATEYYYGIEADGVLDTATDAIGRFKTFNAAPHSFRFSVASCNNSGNHPVFYRIKEKDPLFHITHGDFHYGDPNSATDRNIHRAPMENTLAQPAMKEFLRNHAIAYMWDDHDYCGDNTGSFAVGRTNARLTYQEYVPHYPLPAGAGDVPIYQSFTTGRVRFILTDLRSERTAPGTTMMGAAQKAWFKNQCTDAKNNNQVIIWISSVPWGGTTPTDTWAGFPQERTELSDFFKSTVIQNLLIICGDAHMIAFDDGSNHDFSQGGNPFKYPVLQAAAVNQVGSFRGGPFSHGFFSNPSQQHGQYAALDITDDGGSNISVAITGYRVDSAGAESVLLTYTINFPVLSVLAVRITQFSVAEGTQNGTAVLHWNTEFATNAQCKTMVGERSGDGVGFAAIHQMDCSVTGPVGRHSFTDEKPLKGKNYYRINVVNRNNQSIYSSIQSIDFISALAIDILNNPVTHRLQVAIYAPAAVTARYTIADSAGHIVINNILQLHKGTNPLNVALTGVAAGMYIFNLQADNNQLSKKFLRR